MSDQYLPFEKPIIELETRLAALKEISDENSSEISKEIPLLQKKILELQKNVFTNLSTWQRVQLSRHPLRPHTSDYLELVFDDFIEFHGDRSFKDDPAIIGGLAKLGDRTLMVIGLQKGRSTKEKVFRNFGMPHPEGYRKALRLMKFAERFQVPLVTFVDTPGAYPGIGAEERGQAHAIASCIETMVSLDIPTLTYIIGEGGSGGALALGVADRIVMLEYSIYSVISPEGCAAILWNDQSAAEKAAEAMRVSAREVAQFGFIDEVLEEPLGGAHRSQKLMAKNLEKNILYHLSQISNDSRHKRLEKYRKIGVPL